jgi:hypothetical protein
MRPAHHLDVVDTQRPLGERRTLWREQHLCLRCGHNFVCRIANAINPAGFATISDCAAFEPVQADGEVS